MCKLDKKKKILSSEKVENNKQDTRIDKIKDMKRKKGLRKLKIHE